MTEYTVKIAFWLRAFDSVTVDAELRHGGHRLANAAAKIAMESGAFPEHIDIAERRQGVIAFIDRHEPDGRHTVREDVAFDEDRNLAGQPG